MSASASDGAGRQDLADKYKSSQYEERYERAVARADRMAELVRGWLGYAGEVAAARAEREAADAAAAANAAALKELAGEFEAARRAAAARVARSARAARRMQGDMTQLVRERTAALEAKRDLKASVRVWLPVRRRAVAVWSLAALYQILLCRSASSIRVASPRRCFCSS